MISLLVNNIIPNVVSITEVLNNVFSIPSQSRDHLVHKNIIKDNEIINYSKSIIAYAIKILMSTKYFLV